MILEAPSGVFQTGAGLANGFAGAGGLIPKTGSLLIDQALCAMIGRDASRFAQIPGAA